MELRCTYCAVRACTHERDTEKYPSFCPMPAEPERLAAVERRYIGDPDLRQIACESARTESAGYCRATHNQEIIDFARRMGVTKLGIAHCVGLVEEARIASQIFLAHGFEVAEICCKVGSIDKEKVGT